MVECSLLKQVNATIREFGLGELRERPPYRLSGGEKKVALAAVTVYNPQVLLLDEPTNGLDPRTRKWFLGRLEEQTGRELPSLSPPMTWNWVGVLLTGSWY